MPLDELLRDSQPKCPLCLRVLDRTQHLLRFCPKHPKDTETFVCSMEHLVVESPDCKILCPKPECRDARLIRDGVFLLHVSCEAHNPFWKADRGGVVIPEEPFFNDELEGRVVRRTVTHWELGLLRRVLEVEAHKGRAEMWFPQTLLRATYERPRGKRTGSFIKLCGARSVGKTILAYMALYSRNLDPGQYIEHFIYLPPREAAEQPEKEFLQALYPMDVLAKARPSASDLVLPTAPTRLNMKAVFVANGSSGEAARPRQAATRPQGFLGVCRQLFSKFTEEITHEVSSTDTPSRFSLRRHVIARTPYTLAFYDSAGEEAEREDAVRLAELDRHADVVAALLNAQDLVCFRKQPAAPQPPNYQNSIPIAYQRLHPGQFGGRPVIRCLIVTHLDEVDDADLKRKAAAIVRSSSSQPAGERELLVEWLAAETGDDQDADVQAEQGLLELVGNPAIVHRVFFVWTENLKSGKALPKCRGLGRLVAWCREGAPREGAGQSPPPNGVWAGRASA